MASWGRPGFFRRRASIIILPCAGLRKPVDVAGDGVKQLADQAQGRPSGQRFTLTVAIGILVASFSLGVCALRTAAAHQTSVGSNGHNMNEQTKAEVFHEVLKRMAAGEQPDAKLWSDFVAAQNDQLQTGPKIGAKVPDFTLPDQYGKPHSLRELFGRNGLLLVFTRSAEW
jgi:hypothetical protein